MATGGEETAADSASRSLVVDEATFEEQFLRCQVCNEKFDQNERPPKSLPCNHTFCFPCLQQVFDHSQPPNRRNLLWADDNLDGTLKCPQCRVEIYLSRSEVKKLPNDHRVIQMIDFLSQAVAKSQNVCTKHERQPLNFFCKMCLVPVCRDCTVLDHKEQQGHVIVDVTDALNESRNEFDEVENKSTQVFDRMKSRSDALANASKKLDILERQLRGQIKDTFIEYRLLLERRQEAMIKIMQDMIKDQKAKINARFVSVCEVGTQLQNMFDTFSKARASNDIRQLFTITQQMKEKEQQFKEAADGNDDSLFVAATFEVQNEGVFLSELSGLGDVGSKENLELKQPVPAHQLVVLDMEERQERERMERSQIECSDFDIDREEEMDENDDVIPILVSRILERQRSRGHWNNAQDIETEPDMELEANRRQTQQSAVSRRAPRRPVRDQHPVFIVPESPERGRDSRDGRDSSSSRSSQRSRRAQNPVRIVRHPQLSSFLHAPLSRTHAYDANEDSN